MPKYTSDNERLLIFNYQISITRCQLCASGYRGQRFDSDKQCISIWSRQCLTGMELCKAHLAEAIHELQLATALFADSGNTPDILIDATYQDLADSIEAITNRKND